MDTSGMVVLQNNKKLVRLRKHPDNNALIIFPQIDAPLTPLSRRRERGGAGGDPMRGLASWLGLFWRSRGITPLTPAPLPSAGEGFQATASFAFQSDTPNVRKP